MDPSGSTSKRINCMIGEYSIARLKRAMTHVDGRPLDAPPELVVGAANGRTRLRSMTTPQLEEHMPC
jgi:hypothetical protein